MPTAATKILETLDVEKITLEIQQMKGGSSRGAKSDSVSLPETTTTTMADEDGQSMLSTSESGVHASQALLDGDKTLPEKPKRTKRQLWGDVTISCTCTCLPPSPPTTMTADPFLLRGVAITRAYTFIYTLALLTMLTRIQLNLLGRRSYLSSVVSLATGSHTGAISLENKDDDDNDNATEAAYGDDFEINRKYLTFSWWLLNKGWVGVMKHVEAAVRQVFGQMSPRDQLTYDTFCNMTAQVRKLVEGGSVPVPEGGDYDAAQQENQQQTSANTTSWLTFLLPPPDMEDYVLRESGILDDSATFATQQQGNNNTTTTPSSSSSLRRLLDETSDLIETPTFAHVLTQILDAGFATLLNKKLAPGAFDLDLSPQTTSTDTTRTTPSPPQQQQQETDTSSQQQLHESSPPSSQFLVVRDDLTTTTTSSNQQQQDRRRAEKKVLLPKCLSVLTRQAHAIGDAGPSNEYLAAMEKVRDLEGFAAVVYSSNWENEIREEGMMPAGSEDSSSNRGGAIMSTTTTESIVVKQSQHLEAGEESLVLVDPSQSSFESVWAKVTEK